MKSRTIFAATPNDQVHSTANFGWPWWRRELICDALALGVCLPPCPSSPSRTARQFSQRTLRRERF
jgi:hypothetical protein